jgi:type I restriction enzyme, S subunit
MNKVKLGDMLTFQRGYDLTHSQMENGKIPVVGSSEIIGWHNKANVKAPALLIGRSGTVGRPQYYETDIWAHNTTLFVSDYHDNDPKFCFYFLKKLNLEDYANSSGVPTLNRNFIHPLIVNFPDRPTQTAIARVLSSFDDKIEVNNKINKELENLAKTIYEYWFVQFDFPDEKGKPYKSNGGKMIYNDELKREIPNDWEIKKLNDFCNIFTGKKDVNQTVVNGKYKFFSCAPNPLLSNEYIYDGEAILVSGNGSYTGRVSYYNGKFDLYQRTYACVANNKDISIMPFLYFYMKFLFQPQFKGGTCGSAIPYIVLGDLKKFGIPYKSQLLIRYSQITKLLLKKWFDNQQENDCLAQLRDFLLPLLLNEQVKVNIKK